MATEAVKARARPDSKKSPGQAAHPALSAQRFVSASHRRCAVPYRSDRPVIAAVTWILPRRQWPEGLLLSAHSRLDR